MISTNEIIINALEKISIIIRTLLWDKNKKVGLSPIQIQFLNYIYSNPEEEINSSWLCREFNLTAPTVSDAINVLKRKSLIKKVRSKNDKRNYFIKLTKKGLNLAEEISDWRVSISRQLELFSDTEKELLAELLMKLIRLSLENGIIKISKICFLCENFVENKNPGSDKPHYCNLIHAYMSDADMKFDCRSYKRKIVA
jgi:DNA-binding MarR family transcriptional regulator